MLYSFLINSLYGGGTEKVCKLLANKLAARGHSINLYVFDIERELDKGTFNENVNLIYLGKKNSIKSIPSLIRLVPNIESSAVLVFNHELSLSLLFAKFIRRSNLKIITRMNNTFSVTIRFKRIHYRLIVKRLMKLFYRHMDFYIFQSQGIKEDLVNNYKVQGDFRTIGNPVVIPSFDSDSLKSKIKTNKEILYVGRLVKQKNVVDILKTLNGVREVFPNVSLNIVGDGPEKIALEKFCQDEGIQDIVKFIGSVETVDSYYRNADVTVLSSFNEGFPNVLLESIANRTPVVSYDCPSGPKEIIKEGKNGFLVRYLDEVQLRKKIISSFEHNWLDGELVNSISKFQVDHIVYEYEYVLNLFEQK